LQSISIQDLAEHEQPAAAQAAPALIQLTLS